MVNTYAKSKSAVIIAALFSVRSRYNPRYQKTIYLYFVVYLCSNKYMNLNSVCAFLLPLTICGSALHAAPAAKDTLKPTNTELPIKKLYVGSIIEGAVFSSAIMNKATPTTVLHQPGGTTSPEKTTVWAPLRFTMFLNIGVTFNYNFNRHIGMFTGIDLKNIGFIEEAENDQMIKRRSYNAGIPLGIRIGDMGKNNAAFIVGGGIDYTINYKEKRFISRNEKVVFTEWFSGRTPTLMPYVFAGIANKTNGASIKVTYYPNDFLNPRPGEARKNVRILAVSFGIMLHTDKQPEFKFGQKPTQTIAL